MVTLAVEDRYGTKMVLDPSLPRKPEFLRNSRRALAFSAFFFFIHWRPPYALEIVARVKATVAANRALFGVLLQWDRRRLIQCFSKTVKGSPCRRRVD